MLAMMRNFSIAFRIHLIIGLSAAFSLSAIFALLHQIGRVQANFEELLDSQERQMLLARAIEVSFKTQVQEWKAILLRGNDPQDLNRYRAAFFKQEALEL